MNIFYYMEISGATDKPCGGGLSTLTQKPLLNDT